MRKMIHALALTSLTSGFASAPATKPRVAPEITAAVGGIAMPEAKRAGSATIYPFGGLEVGHAFGVKNKDKRGMSSVLSNQNRKHKGKDEAGNAVSTKHYTAVDVDADLRAKIKGTALEGSTVLVFRDK